MLPKPGNSGVRAGLGYGGEVGNESNVGLSSLLVHGWSGSRSRMSPGLRTERHSRCGPESSGGGGRQPGSHRECLGGQKR